MFMKKNAFSVANKIVIFGALGDLSRRKLMPSLYQLERAGLLADDFRIIAVARDRLTLEDFCKSITESLQAFVHETLDVQTMSKFLSKLIYQSLDLQDIDAYQQLAQVLLTVKGFHIYYYSTAPDIYGDICKGLQQASLIGDEDRVVLEKPIGHCLATSKRINDQVSCYFAEEQIYRIDHYLGKETVLNLLVLRFANTLFTNNWDRNCIDHVQITIAESVGIEGRWDFYDEVGQLRDMVQSHLLQILSLLAMEPPADLSADSIRDEKLKVIRALKPITRKNVKDKTVRGQYTDGNLNALAVPGYLNETDANANSTTETFIAIKAEIDNWRWAGVPFYLRTGKRMPKKHSEIVVHFKPQAHNIFSENYAALPSNKLTIRLQPDEGVELEMMNKIPGISSKMHIHENKLDLSFSQAYDNQRVVDAYERLLLEIVNNNQSLFVRRDEVEAAWQWVDSIIGAWQSVDEKPKPYAAGTSGPDSSISLIARDDREWVD